MTAKSAALAAVPAVEDDEPQSSPTEAPVRKFTLVEHHAAVYGGNSAMKDRVQVVPVDSTRLLGRVQKSEGELFDSYAEAEALAQAANAHAVEHGELAGHLSGRVIGEARIYVPLRKPVA